MCRRCPLRKTQLLLLLLCTSAGRALTIAILVMRKSCTTSCFAFDTANPMIIIMSLPFCTITASIALRQTGRQNSNAIIWHSFHGVDITDKLQLKMCKTVAGEDGQAVMTKKISGAYL